MERNQPVLLRRAGTMKDPASVAEYERADGFAALRKAVHMDREDILREMETANLRGRGGAAFPAGRKWRHLYEIEETPKYIVCNADEGEPGTFKDKILLGQDPLSVIEGMIIAGYLFRAEAGYIYIRGEYREIQQTFRRALQNAEQAGCLGKDILGVEGFDYTIHVISGAGAYVCGENSALLNSIEGRSGRPRVKPPHLAEVGLFLHPTLVNNVESFACVPVIVREGGAAFLSLGAEDGGGTKLVPISGHAKNRGVYEVNLGLPFRELLESEQYAGGSSTGRPVKFCHIGGQSGPIGYAEDLRDAVFSYQGLWDKGLSMGSGAVVVMDDSVSIVEYLQEVMAFFIHESCGKCTPCRVGITRIHELIGDFLEGRAREGDIERLEQYVRHVSNLSACGLGQSAGTAIRTALKRGRGEFEALIARS